MQKQTEVHQQAKTMTLVSTWIGVYPLITGLALLFEPLLRDEPIPLRTLVLSLLMVPIMVLIISPVMNSLITRFWQVAENDSQK